MNPGRMTLESVVSITVAGKDNLLGVTEYLDVYRDVRSSLQIHGMRNENPMLACLETEVLYGMG